MITLDDVRKRYQLDDWSDSDIVAHLSEASNTPPDEVMRTFGVQMNEPGFVSSFKRGFGGTAEGLGRVAGEWIPGISPGNALQNWGEDVQARNPSGIHSFEDIKNDPWLAFREATGTVGSMAAQFIPQVMLGGVPAAATGASTLARVGTGAARAFGSVPAQAAVAGLPSYADIRASQDEEGVADEWWAKLAALVGSGAVGAIEVGFGLQPRLAKLVAGAKTPAEKAAALELVKKEIFGKTPLRTAAKEAAKVTAAETGEELLQTPIEQLAGATNPLTPASLKETALSGTMAAIGTAPLGLGAGGYRGLQHRAMNGPAVVDVETPPLETPPAAPPGTYVAPEFTPAEGATLETPEDRQAAIDATATSEELADKARGAVRAELDRLGLKDIGADVVDRIVTPQGGEAEGVYSPRRKLVQLALDTPEDQWVGVVNHEVIHAVRALGLLDDREWKTLTRAAEAYAHRHVGRVFSYLETYAGKGKSFVDLPQEVLDRIHEEMIADMHRDFREGKLRPMKGLAVLMDRVTRIMEALRNGLHGAGFQSSAGVFERIQSGEVGARPRGEVAPATEELFSLRPVAPWSGGKRWIAKDIRSMYESSGANRFVDLFSGGGSVSLGVAPSAGVAVDKNQHIINLYKHIQAGHTPQYVYPATKEGFVLARKELNQLVAAGQASSPRAADLYYQIAVAGYGGKQRMTKDGRISAAPGRYPVNVPDFAEIRKALQGTDFIAEDALSVKLQPGDFVYADPPYDDSTDSYYGSFNRFTWDDQVALANKLAAHRGPVVVSNSYNQKLVELYRNLGFDVKKVSGVRQKIQDTKHVEMLATKGLAEVGEDKFSLLQPKLYSALERAIEAQPKLGLTGEEWLKNSARHNATNPSVSATEFAALNRIFGTKLDATKLGQNQARFNWLMQKLLTLPQVERENWDVPGVRPFVDAARNWWATKGYWVSQWDEWVDSVRKSGYGKAEQSNIWRFANEVTVRSDELGRLLTAEEKAEEARKVGGLDAGQMDIWIKGRKLLQSALNELEVWAIKRITGTWNDRIAQETDIATRIEMEKARDENLKTSREDFQKMRNRDYWPLARFGEFTVHMVAQSDLRFMGKDFKKGDTILFELYATEGEQLQRKAALLKAYDKKVSVAAGKVDESIYGFMGLPPSIMRMMESDLTEVVNDYLVGDEKVDKDTLEMLTKQLNALRTAMLHFTPENAFKQRLLRRKGTRGFTDDGLRAMAATGQSFAGHIARAAHRGEMDESLKTLDEHRKNMEFATEPELIKEGNKLTDLLNFLRRSQKDMMNPGEDLANLRALGFLWHLGGVVRSAVVQVGQPIFTTYPWLAARYGDGAAVAEMARAYKDLRRMFQGKGAGLAVHLEEALEKAMEAGFLNQSLFTELAGLAEGSNLQRLLPGKFLKSQEAATMIRRTGYYASFLFQKGEELNRFVTFKAAYMAELRKQLGMESATEEEVGNRMTQLAASGASTGAKARRMSFIAGRTAVETTQGEYARWARPEIMRGKKSAIFLFKMYTQLMNYFALRDPGKWRFLAIQLAVAGALGLPFAEDLLDLLNAATQGELCKTGDVRNCVREYMQELDANPELVMHGMSRYGLPWDLSASMSLGRVVPGVEPATQAMMPGGDLAESALRLQSEMLGALFAIPLNIAKAATTGKERDVEQAMPTVIRDTYRTVRRFREGGERSRSGAMIADIDWGDPIDVAVHLGQALGFRPTEIAVEREIRWSQKEAGKYWLGRRTALTGQYYQIYKTGGPVDREALADVKEAIAAFNQEVPFSEMKILPMQLRKGLKISRGRHHLEEAGIAPEKKYRRLYSDIAEGFER